MHVSLQKQVDNLYFPKQLAKLKNQCLDNPNIKTDITFWGTRLIVLGDECVTLDQLSKKVYKIALDPLVTCEHMETGLDVVNHLNRFYVVTDRQCLHKNFLTQLFVWIREFWYFTDFNRFCIEQLVLIGTVMKLVVNFQLQSNKN